MILISLFHGYIPLDVKRFFFTIGLSIKELMLFFLPILILCILFRENMAASSNAAILMIFILMCVILSNFFSTFISQYCGQIAYKIALPLMKSNNAIAEQKNALTPFWIVSMPKIMSTEFAMITGIAGGSLASRLLRKDILDKTTIYVDKLVGIILSVISAMTPAFVIGFFIKLQHDGLIKAIIKDYGIIFMGISSAIIIYMIAVYFFLGGKKSFIQNAKNMIPAAIGGFSSMSSAATMPITMAGVEKNVNDKRIARHVIPFTTGCHLVGDCFAIPILAYAVLKNYGMPEPTFYEYFRFMVSFVFAKFSVVAVPGGGVLVMLPILSAYFGFTAEMSALIVALYVLLDPIITTANIIGNGALAKAIDILYPMFVKKIGGRIGRYKGLL